MAAASGFEKLVLRVQDALLKFNRKVDTLFYGNPNKANSKNPVQRIGIYGSLQELNGIPICDVFTYILSKIKPKADSPELQTLNRLSQGVDKVLQVVNSINKFPTTVFTPQGGKPTTQYQVPEEKRKELNDLKVALSEVFTPGVLDSLAQFPQGVKVREQIDLSLSYIYGIGSLQSIPSTKLQNIQKTLSNLQAVLTGIKAYLSGPTALLPGVSKFVPKLNEFAPPEKLVEWLRTVVLNPLQALAKGVQAAIKAVRALLTTAKVIRGIVTALKVILNATGLLPVTPGAVAVKTPSVVNFLNNLKKVTEEIIAVTSVIIKVLTGILSKISLIIIELNKLLATLQQCKELKDSGIVQDLQQTVDDLTKAKEDLQDLLNELQPPPITPGGTIQVGDYTFEILEEKVVDRDITLTRRWAVAYDENGVLVGQGTPSFASDTQILIEELKLKLNITDQPEETLQALTTEYSELLTSSSLNNDSSIGNNFTDENSTAAPKGTVDNSNAKSQGSTAKAEAAKRANSAAPPIVQAANTDLPPNTTGSIFPTKKAGVTAGGGSSVSASYALTASYAETAVTASYFSGSISNAVSSSYALSASYAFNSTSASYARTASYALTSATPFLIATGSVTASVNVTPNDIFIIKTGGDTVFNINKDRDTTLFSNLFIVKNYTTQEPVLTVSQSIVQIATQSSNPIGNEVLGGFWFTSSSLFIGLG